MMLLKLCVYVSVRKRKQIKPLGKGKVRRLRRKRLLERQMWSFVKELTSYVLFVLVVLSLVLGTKDSQAYLLKDVINKMFIAPLPGEVGTTGDISVS